MRNSLVGLLQTLLDHLVVLEFLEAVDVGGAHVLAGVEAVGLGQLAPALLDVVVDADAEGFHALHVRRV